MDWYRTPGWTLAEQEHFERKLARARKENRAEYLRIKGLSLEDAGATDAARTLFVRAAVEAGKNYLDQSCALENLADSIFDDDPAESERLLRRLIEVNPTLNGTTHMAEVHLAELLIRCGTPEALSEAREHLDSWDARGAGDFSVQLFEAAVARARWNEATGNATAAAEWAAHALELAAVESPLTNAPGLAVQDLDDELAAWLTDLAGGSVTVL
ncbi:hypothetical protein [Brachybacterium paraconglomeratum]|uniref:hypothetical protein n=1 Tax=Brachybacterium paraconglomeratum TaxID=173362 RepID=UPI00223AD79D|nr:hypothetical protein [Brachybacterium paraconglomeratum]MCT1438377.1 hypothetical protein [Brachybacterium paraconglomeratum]